MKKPSYRPHTLSRRKPTAPWRAISLLVFAATLLIGVTTATAVHDIAQFELDGDPFHGDATVMPPGGYSVDWDEVCKEATASTSMLCQTVLGSTGAQRTLFITDESGAATTTDDQPATGGTHHVNDLTSWDCTKAGISPSKNDITHAYAATYELGGQTHLYFGLDRIDAGTGDAAVGFWFYRGIHTCTPTLKTNGGYSPANFTGVHAIGDVLITSEFTNGGGVSSILVYKWVGGTAGDADHTTSDPAFSPHGPIQLEIASAACRNDDGTYVAGGDDACATVNKVGTDGSGTTPGTGEGGIVPPWPYTNLDGGNYFKLGAFFEGGVNATALGLDLGCGGTFLADTQASQSLTSQIHDFAIGNLSLCDLEVTKTGPEKSKPTDDASYTVTIHNTGGITLYRDSITDTLVGDLTDGSNTAIDSDNCGTSLAAGASCTITYHYTVDSLDPDPLPNSVDVTYNSKNDLTGDEVTRSDDFSVNLFQPSITLDKTANPTTAKAGDSIDYTVTINNTSSDDAPNLILDSLTDTLVGDLTNAANYDDSTCGTSGASLASGGSCVIHYHRVVQGGDPDPLLNTATAHYHPDGFTNNITASDGASVHILATPSISTTLSVSAVEIGGTVHDTATLTGATGTAGGSVTYAIYTDNTCQTPYATQPSPATVTVTNGSVPDSGGVTFNSAGTYYWQATYSGDPDNVGPVTSECTSETLVVVDANIQITPDGTNRIGADHIFTGHVNVNDGSGFANAPDGTQISFTIDSGPGAFTTTNPCTTTGGTGSCSITLSSAVTGVTMVSAHTTVSVGGVSLTRNTDGTGANSGPATKTWVNARISIAPDATNEIGQSHTFTVTLEKDLGDGGGYIAAASEHVDVTLTDSLGADHSGPPAPTGTCLGAGPNTNASGQCTITFTSLTPGQVTGHASSTLSVGGSASFTVETDGVAPNSDDAVKTFVDANIQITPATDTDPVGDTHTLTGHVNVNAGLGGGYVNAPDDTLITFSIVSGPGSFVGAVNTCTTTGGTGSCTVQITSAVTGTTTIRATTTVSVGGVSLTRTTGDAHVGDSADAQKSWEAGTIIIRKVTIPAGGTGFGYTTTGGLVPATFNLDDGQNRTYSNQATGNYSVAENDPSPYSLTNIDCSATTGAGTSATPNIGARSVDIVLAADGIVDCTYTNTLPPTLTIIKYIQGPSETFSYTVTGANTLGSPATDLTPPADGSDQYGPVDINIGSSTISEDPTPTGYTLTDVECHGYTGGGTGAGPLDTNGVPTNWNFNATYGDHVICTYVNSALQTTRTQGFWATHTHLANDVWNGTNPGLGTTLPAGATAVIGSVDDSLCGVQITAIPTPDEENWLMGGFWSNISQKSNHSGKRAKIDQARMQMLQQYLAAVLNVYMFGSGSEAMLDAARSAYCGTNLHAIKVQVGILGGFNESGDSLPFTPGSSATAQASRHQADIDAWDAPGVPGSSDESD